jgi:uncharacterized membrane protein YhaH (DUF805 family)
MSDELNREQTEGQAAPDAAESVQAAPEAAAYQQTAPDAVAQSQDYTYGQAGQNPGGQYYSGAPERMTGIFEAYASYWKNYANFNDRTSRAGFWWVVLINNIIGWVLSAALLAPILASIPAMMIGDNFALTYTSTLLLAFSTGYGIVIILWELVNLIPALSLFIRRLHDTGKSWLYILFGLIPFVGWIILIVFAATATKYPPENRFFNVTRRG